MINKYRTKFFSPPFRARLATILRNCANTLAQINILRSIIWILKVTAS